MSLSITLQIAPENLNFLNQLKKKASLSSGQQCFLGNLKETYDKLAKLKKQDVFEFTAKNENEVSRGAFYAITTPLRKKLPQEKISLENLQTALENELQVKDKQILSFITLCLVEPVWLPGALSTVVCSLLSPTAYFCSNQSQSDSLRADVDNKQIEFHLNLHINIPGDKKPLFRGTATICFRVDNTTTQVELLPINIQLIFSCQEETEQFKCDLLKEFKGWVLSQAEFDKIQRKNQTRWPMLDFCIIPILIGVLFSLVAMVGMLALSFTPFSPLLIPPVYLGLSLILTSIASSYAYPDRKKDKEKLQRPIYLFHKKSSAHSQTQAIPSTSFFIPKSNQPLVENNMKYHP